MDYQTALRWLDSHLNHEAASASAGGVVAGNVSGLTLGPMRELMGLLGDPQDEIPSVHITGTNGKGTVGSMVSAILMAHGLSVGSYSSPHIAVLNERISRNGTPISDEDLAEVLTGIAAVTELVDAQLSWFELMTAAAFRWFAEVPVDASVIEVGLLGRHDATNVVDPRVSVVTSIQGDHTDFAPGWKVAVATEKAGIISPGSTAVLGLIDDDLIPVFQAEGPKRLLRAGVDFTVADDRVALGGHLIDVAGAYGTYEDVFVPLHGAPQVNNAAVALVSAEEFFERELDHDVVREAFAGLALPGRFEVIGHKPLRIIDGAHNADAIESAARTLDEEFSPVGRRTIVLGLLGGRDPQRAIGAIEKLRPDLVIATELEPPRGIPAHTVANLVEAAGMNCQVVIDPVDAVTAAVRISEDEDLVMAIGSFRIIAPAKAAFASLG